MTSFGRWLGEHNGESMLASAFGEDLTKEQARCVVTTYCILFDIEVDTRGWDDLMKYIYVHYNSWFDSYSVMDDYMCEFLV